MTERKWTPGPWEMHCETLWEMLSDDVRGDRVCGLEFGDGDAQQVSEANAHLIAAAPDLYEANDWLIKVITDLLRGKPVRDADEAISFSLTVQAKARGEQ